MPIHPNSLANLRPPWTSQPEYRGSAKHVERTLALAHKGCPKAMRRALSMIDDEELHPGIQLAACKLVLDHGMPKGATGAQVTIGAEGADWLDVRFHFPGSDTKPNGHAETVRVSFDAEGD